MNIIKKLLAPFRSTPKPVPTHGEYWTPKKNRGNFRVGDQLEIIEFYGQPKGIVTFTKGSLCGRESMSLRKFRRRFRLLSKDTRPSTHYLMCPDCKFCLEPGEACRPICPECGERMGVYKRKEKQ